MENKNISSKLKINFFKKIILVLFGIALSIVLLEAGLCLGSFALRSLQEYRNLISIRNGGEYRIMCIGESTTQGEYPYFLEEALDKHNIGIKFSVIDKGIGGTNTSLILAQLEKNIEKYRPHLVIAMIGINDGSTHIPVGFNSGSRTFFNSLRVYKLTKLFLLHLQNRIKETRVQRKPDTLSISLVKNNQSVQSCVNPEQKNQKSIQSPDAKDKEVKDDNFFYELGKQLSNQEDLPSAKEAFIRAVELNPYNVAACFSLICFYDDWATKESLIRRTIQAYRNLIKIGKLYDSPKFDIYYLGISLIHYGMYLEIEELCKEMLAENIMRETAYTILGLSAIKQEQYSLAEIYFKEAIELDSHNLRALDGLAVVYHETERYDLSEQYLRKANELRPCYLTMLAVRNYKKIKEILDKKKIQLVCV